MPTRNAALPATSDANSCGTADSSTTEAGQPAREKKLPAKPSVIENGNVAPDNAAAVPALMEQDIHQLDVRIAAMKRGRETKSPESSRLMPAQLAAEGGSLAASSYVPVRPCCPGTNPAGATSLAHTSDTAIRKDLMPVSASRWKDPRPVSTARQEDPKLVSRARNARASSATVMRNQTIDRNAASTGTGFNPGPSRDESTSDLNTTAQHASQATPGAFTITGIDSDNHYTENVDPEQPGWGMTLDVACDLEAAADSQETTPQTPIRAFAVRGTNGNARADELLRRHLVANAPLVEAVQDDPNHTDVSPAVNKCSPGDRSRRTWALFALLIAIIAMAATAMGLFIPRSSSPTESQEDATQSEFVAPSSIPTKAPSLLPSLTPTFHPDALRFRSIQAMLVPLSGVEALSDISSPQYRALEWVSLIDPLRLNTTGADRKRIIQRYILATLYYTTSGEHWANNYHFLEDLHECDWWSLAKENKWNTREEGVFCSKGREVGVNFVHMISNNLTGTLPSELQGLTDLELLYLYGNEMNGPIPEFIGNMTSLAHLMLSANMHSGTIPDSFGRLTNLQDLRLYSNMLNGTIPSSLGRLSSLEGVSLPFNSLTGTIPKSFSNLTNLHTLRLNENMLIGTIPSALERITSLEVLMLSQNNLTSTIPEPLGALTNLQRLWLYDNMLNGTIPAALGRLSSLEDLSLNENNLTGTIPERLGALTNLQRLWLYDNMLNGTIPAALGQLSSLEDLLLSGNSLTGTFPGSFGNLTSLKDLRVHANMLNGTIPSELGLLTSLENLILVKNSLTGPIPESFSDLTNLHSLRLMQNMLNGTIPSALGRLSNLRVLVLSGNRLTGMIPNQLCQRKESGVLDLRTNPRTAKGKKFSCKCIPVEGLSGCCVIRPNELGNGQCASDEPYNTEACLWDGGDCSNGLY